MDPPRTIEEGKSADENGFSFEIMYNVAVIVAEDSAARTWKLGGRKLQRAMLKADNEANPDENTREFHGFMTTNVERGLRRLAVVFAIVLALAGSVVAYLCGIGWWLSLLVGAFLGVVIFALILAIRWVIQGFSEDTKK